MRWFIIDGLGKAKTHTQGSERSEGQHTHTHHRTTKMETTRRTRDPQADEVVRALEKLRAQIDELQKRNDAQHIVDSGVNNISQLFEQGRSVIIGFLSDVIYATLQRFGDGFEMTVLMVLVFIVWIMLSGVFRKFMVPFVTRYTLDERGKGWRMVIENAIDFISLLFVFVVFRFLIQTMMVGWFGAALSPSEAIAGAYLLIMLILSTFILIKFF
jgi:hypothetical protein